MKLLKIIIVLIGLITIISCKNEPKSLSDFKSNFYEIQHNGLRLGDSLNVYFFENEDLVKSVEIIWNGKLLKNHTIMDSTNTSLGINNLKIKVNLENNSISGETNVPILNSFKETLVEFEVVKEYPHPQELFTQGFFFHNNKIFESAGQYKKSKLVTYNLGSTNYLQEKKLDDRSFAEGAALLNGKIYQLTYRERDIFVYDEKTFELIETLKLPSILKEVWGITTNGKELIVADGTQNIYFFDEKFNLQRKIQIAGYASIYNQLNEMEFIQNKIYANVWQTNYVLIINPVSGAVEQYYDLASLSQTKGSDDVLNGIAAYGNNILVTGKNWNKIYELSVK
ncbi:glutaminyl-peptide cyclotransferase [Moheibacter sediminis]|uniref:Glutamine cyclotransferase n=1 Tax=Moheibacter sediminis TaxID=1434700 RepID=A0A1W1Y922_9FLAO|nr:glutaminyl-peptide cyclotransferase [Moheibacter sediminis]SMC32662.1 Glutamine cyclotransferase [Moheibacter sediminis]